MIHFIKEACVGNLQEAINAEKKGADRIELCANLEVGGTTPSKKLIAEAVQKLSIPIRVMIRPRGGDFHYQEEEVTLMKNSIEYCKEIGVEAVVFGLLRVDHSIDIEKTAELIRFAQPLEVVIHKAIDATPDPVEALRELTALEGITTVLTSGGKPTAHEGRKNLKKMIEIAGDRFEVMPGGKVTDKNVQELHQYLQASVYHGKRIVGEL